MRANEGQWQEMASMAHVCIKGIIDTVGRDTKSSEICRLCLNLTSHPFR